MITTDGFCKKEYGEKLYRLSFNAHMGCPNRGGPVAVSSGRGCIFCSEGGSGEFAVDITGDTDHDIKLAIDKVSNKFKGRHYIAYFQAYSNTYAPVDELRKLYMDFVNRDEIAVLAIATRPDCLDEDKYELLEELNRIKPVWVELGLQTVKPESVSFIRRGYDNEAYDRAVRRLYLMGIHTITHVILYLPGETKQDMLNTVRHIVKLAAVNGKYYSAGIKFSMLNVLKGTDLYDEYAKAPFYLPELEEYGDTLKECLNLLPENIVVHRLCSDPPKKLLVAPSWVADKKRVHNYLNELIDPPEDYYVYIIRCNDNTLYTGVARDVDKRFREHQNGRGAKYTRSHHPVETVYTEKVRGKGRALKREYEIKQLSRSQKLDLIKKRKYETGAE